MLSAALLWCTPAAWAGSGPWVVGAGSSSVFVALESQRLGTLSTQLEDGPEEVDVGEGPVSYTHLTLPTTPYV